MLQPKSRVLKLCSSFLASAVFVVSAFAPVSVSAQAAKAAPAKQSPDPVEISLERKKVTVVEGKEVLVSADTAKPGETLVETATYVNKSSTSVTKLEATLPVPANTEFVAGSALPAGARASTDGKTFAAMPLKRKSTSASGVITETTVPLAEYKFLRWTIGSLAAGKSVIVSAKVKVAQDSPARK